MRERCSIWYPDNQWMPAACADCWASFLSLSPLPSRIEQILQCRTPFTPWNPWSRRHARGRVQRLFLGAPPGNGSAHSVMAWARLGSPVVPHTPCVFISCRHLGARGSKPVPQYRPWFAVRNSLDCTLASSLAPFSHGSLVCVYLPLINGFAFSVFSSPIFSRLSDSTLYSSALACLDGSSTVSAYAVFHSYAFASRLTASVDIRLAMAVVFRPLSHPLPARFIFASFGIHVCLPWPFHLLSICADSLWHPLVFPCGDVHLLRQTKSDLNLIQ